jgi:adenosylcobinamide-phosphate synthase
LLTWEGLLVLLVAIAFDTVLGEPPTPLHPVVWMGNLVNFWKRLAPAKNRFLQLLYGMAIVLVSAWAVYAFSSWFIVLLHQYYQPAALIVQVYLLKSCFSIRMLAGAGLTIRNLIKKGDLAQARFEMRSLVSRDTSRLNEEQILAATIESVTENTTDSFVAPLLFYILLGVPGALVYRLINTFDSMIGYRGKYEYLGKAAARLDDILNYIPARLSALLVIISAPLYQGDLKNAWRVARRDHANTASPNAGWTMAAMAGALNVQLEKVGHYLLGDDDRILVPGLINQAVMALYLVAGEISLLYALAVTVSELL